ncbi:DUF433 domain-containing protein [Planctomicrobium piriforme]|uniref:DUF433 domain-containing protein n=1 Tax=Planctomicrobium piriforme TaxID=1576369 RepID=A0A1I3LUC3_9PLAN|nr:DUF433 domain-containing protein [Planctomicrobium piriforme]SFI88351.1 Protein of unknown function [Planctomicrobium piriforme]
MSAIAWPMIAIDAQGIAYVEGTRIKVIEIALDRIAHHWDVDEIRRQHPQLSLVQIHAALAYYYDNQSDCDRLIQARDQTAEALRRELENSQVQRKLR